MKLKDAYPLEENLWATSVQFSCSVMSNSLWPHGLQHHNSLCPSPTPRVYPNSWPLSRWCHPTISSSVIPFSSCPQFFPSIRVFSNESGGQSIGVSASTSVLPMNTQDWSPLRWTGWISLWVGHNFTSKECLLISRLQLPSAVILDPQKIKSATVFTVSPPT